MSRDIALPRLPKEIQVEILEKLSGDELLHLSTISPDIQALVDATASLQYKIELFLAGMLPPKHGADINAFEALKQLRTRENAWKNFKPVRSRTIDLRPSTDRVTWEQAGLLATRQENTSALTFYQLSSEPHWGLPDCWDIPDVGFRVRSLKVYPDQDLLVLAEEVSATGGQDAQDAIAHRIHLLSLASGMHHPSAKIPVITLKHAQIGWTMPHMSVSSDLLGVLVSGEYFYGETELWVLDWKRGTLRLNAYHPWDVSTGRDRPTTSGVNFYFLQHGLLLLPVIESRQKGPGGSCALYVYDCKHEVPGRLPYRDVPRVAMFRLPKPTAFAAYTNIYGITNDLGPSCDIDNSKAFTPNPAYSVLGFQLEIYKHTADDERDDDASSDDSLDLDLDAEDSSADILLLFVHAGTLERRCHGDVHDADILWEEWAQHARLMPLPSYSDTWFGGPISHTRVILQEKPEFDPTYGVARRRMTDSIYDFPPPETLRRASTTDQIGPWTCIIQAETLPDTMPYFEGTVISGLPYRKLRIGLHEAHRSRPALSGDCLMLHRDGRSWQLDEYA